MFCSLGGFILSRIATALRGHDCEKLVKRTKTNVKLSGIAIDAGPIDVKFGVLRSAKTAE